MAISWLSIKPLVALSAATLLLALLPVIQATADSWQTTIIPQTYWQSYDGSLSRKQAFNTGVYVVADYLDSSTVSFGYNYTVIDFKENAELREHIVYLNGQQHYFLDALPGKLSLRLSAYLGEELLEYDTANPPGSVGGGGSLGGGMHGRGMNVSITSNGNSSTNSSTTEETSDITVYYPQLTFINYSKTFYTDIGYAQSEYKSTFKTEADQFTVTVGIGGNESRDWLQLRGYLINTDSTNPDFSDDEYESVQVKYTHWFPDRIAPQIEFLQLSALLGDRQLAVDADAAVVYSAADKQTGNVAGSLQWKLSPFSKLQSLVSYSRFENEFLNDKYNSLLLYLNYQHQW